MLYSELNKVLAPRSVEESAFRDKVSQPDAQASGRVNLAERQIKNYQIRDKIEQIEYLVKEIKGLL